MAANAELVERTHTIPSGVPGLDVVHIPTWTPDDGLPLDGEWSVTMPGEVAVQRCGFRTFHAALHYVLRIKDLADWTRPREELTAGEAGEALRESLRHAEAHAHEVDAVYPVGSWIPFSNGPAILDDDGTTRQFMRGAPSIDWKKDEESTHRCAVCGDEPKVRFDWMDGP